MRSFLAAAISLLLFTPVASSAVRAELTIFPGRTLPGLSVELYARVTTDSPVVLSRLVRVRVTAHNVAPFVAKWGNGKDYGEMDVVDHELSASARTSTDVFVVPRNLDNPSWALDERLSEPGEYQLEVLLYRQGDLESPVAVSTPASLKIESPNPRDREIWQRVSSGKCRREVAEDVLANSPESTYLPYLTGSMFRDTNAQRIEMFRRIVNLHPNSPLTPSLNLWLAVLCEFESRTVFSVENDLDKAVSLAIKERAILDAIVRGSDPWARMKARRTLDDGIPTRETLLEDRQLSVAHH
jgi:hypothetical protein